MCKRMTYSRILSSLTLLAAVCVLSRGQLENVNMQSATQQLARRFEEVRTVGLGIDSLQNEYNRVGFTFSRLDDAQIDTLLSNVTASQTIASILVLFDTIASSNTSLPSSPLPTNCCDTSPQSTQSCCYGCGTVPPNTQLLSTIESTYSTSNLSGVELEFGFSGGSILRYPTFQPRNETCSQTIPDARLQPWYIDTIRVRPREVVLLVDSTEPTTTTNAFPTLRTAAKQILESLTYQDKVGVIVVDVLPSLPLEFARRVVIPVCQTNKDALANFLDSSSSGRQIANYSRAFSDAFSLFTNDTNSDKLLLFFTHGATAPVDSNGTFFELTPVILSTIMQRNMETGNSVVISVYREREVFGDPFRSVFFDQLPQDQRGPLITLTGDGRSVTNYYSIFLNSSATSSENTLSHQLNSNGVNSLSISRAFYDGSSLLGVFHAVLPWQQLFGHIAPVLSRRQSSYFFIVGRDQRRLLYHPLFPSQLQSNALVTDFETEGQILSALDMAESQPSSTQRTSVRKLYLLPTSHRDFNGLVRREVPSTYHCRAVGTTGAQLYGCVVLADEDVATVVQRRVNVTEAYMSQSPRRRPIYHTVQQSIPTESQCDYFCRISTSGELSFQLTGDSAPTAQAPVQDITRYIGGTGTRPPFVQPGVASETAINSVVAASWLDQSSMPSEYITRRHLATPSGLYLTYPPLHRVREFQPLQTEWYTTIAGHTSTLTLTPPRINPLREGGRLVVSIGSALRAPADQSDMDLSDGGQLLSVVAADITFASLRTFVGDALPLCEQDRVSCFIMDDLGRLVYHADFFRSDFNGEPVFFSSSSFQEHRPILIDLLLSGTISKRQCVDHFNTTIRERRFFSVSTQDETYRNLDGNSCSRYLVRHIPGTNAFFAVVESMSECSNIICFCLLSCFNCDTLQRTSCGCPCHCPEDCMQPAGVPPCPRSLSEDANDRADLSATITGGRELNCGSNCTSQCFNQNCKCREDLGSCNEARDCYWCQQEQKCVHHTECCSFEDSNACCGASPQRERFSYSPECLSAKCLRDPDGPDVVCPNATTPPTGQPPLTDAGAVVAGVVGGLVGLLLLLVFIGFILWYQFCRIKEPEDEASPVSAFDFSGKRLESVNPAASTDELGGDDEVKSPEYASKKDETTI